jgi:hypothetical protein
VARVVSRKVGDQFFPELVVKIKVVDFNEIGLHVLLWTRFVYDEIILTKSVGLI